MKIACVKQCTDKHQIQTFSGWKNVSRTRHCLCYFQLDEGSGNKVNNIGSLQLLPGDLYGTEWTSFAPMQQTTPHEFSPRTDR